MIPESGLLKYKSEIVYLGVIITDIGSIKHDVHLYINKKRANVSIKFTNSCKTNRNAPLYVKLEVLEKCVSSALTYACETWGSHINEVELCHRSGLKTALKVRQNLNNEIVYIETGKWAPCSQIKKAQLKFWIYMNEYKLKYPDSALAKVLQIGLNNNVPYLKYYEQIKREYTEPASCQKAIEKTYYDMFKRKMRMECEKDADSKLGTYYLVNPLLRKYVPNPQPIMETEGELVTRYRSGSHSLAIELGRYSNTIRENRT